MSNLWTRCTNCRRILYKQDILDNYKLLYEKKPLPAWHPLLTGQKETTHGSGVSVRGSTISEKSVNEDDWENYIITDPK